MGTLRVPAVTLRCDRTREQIPYHLCGEYDCRARGAARRHPGSVGRHALAAAARNASGLVPGVWHAHTEHIRRIWPL
jgi:hypothetical protein